MSWYKKWFDSPLYEKLYISRDTEEAAQLAELISGYFPVQQYPSLLDLGCGRGRHSIRLAELGYKVTGVDLSDNSISEARTRAAQLDLGNVSFIKRDMRYPLKRKYDVIANLFTSFGYFTKDNDNLEVLKSISSMLELHGGLILDYMNAPLVKRTFKPVDSGAEFDVQYDIRRFVEDDTIIKQLNIKDYDGQDHFFEERVKLYNYKWFAEKLSGLGFHIESVLGNYNGDKYKREESPRLILIAVKNKEI